MCILEIYLEKCVTFQTLYTFIIYMLQDSIHIKTNKCTTHQRNLQQQYLTSSEDGQNELPNTKGL
jgi:hypothetical protein